MASAIQFRYPETFRAARLIRHLGLVTCVVSGFCTPSVGFQQSAPPTKPGATTSATDSSSHGRKLVLKDGTFQIVRTYERNGERVRYFSVERSAWEEIPAAMIDWDATAKASVTDADAETALVAKVRTQEQAQIVQPVLEVDASLQLAAGVFLPAGEGMFIFADRRVLPLEQVGSAVKTDKKTVFKQVISPIPIIPSKHNIVIPGAKATIRISLDGGVVEFYLREPFPDAEHDSPILKSSRGGINGPEVELVRATVKGHTRQLESIRSMFGQQLSTDAHTISLQRWETAPAVYRFTLSEPLPPGEYALAEVLPDGMNLFVWDFGVDKAEAPRASTVR